MATLSERITALRKALRVGREAGRPEAELADGAAQLAALEQQARDLVVRLRNPQRTPGVPMVARGEALAALEAAMTDRRAQYPPGWRRPR